MGAWADRLGRARVTVNDGGQRGLLAGDELAARRARGGRARLEGPVVANSAQFSVLVTEVAPPQAVGAVLTLVTSPGCC